MRIAIDARYLGKRFGGPATYAERLLESLSEADSENEYRVLIQRGYPRHLNLGENFHLIWHDAPPLSWSTLLGLHRLLNREKPDLFHALFPITPIFYRGKMVVTLHDLQPMIMEEWSGRRPPWKKKAYDSFYRWAYPNTFRRAERIITVSQATKNALVEIYPKYADKTQAILSGYRPPPASNPENADQPMVQTFALLKKQHRLPERYVLYVGSTRPNKNLPNMLKAFARLREQSTAFDDVAFVLVLSVDRFLRDVIDIIQVLNLERRVRILQPVGPEEKSALYQNAQLLFFATKHEGFGFPVLEAQAQGTPVLGAHSGSTPEISGNSALLADPDDIEDLAKKLRLALEGRTLRLELSRRGLENLKRFSWEKTARAVLDVYRQAVLPET